MASKEIPVWLSFFKSAGIPAGPALTYATLFVDNRMQVNMLMDLNKEYLRDMGITVLGDIIAILKYAKTAHAAFERDKPAMDAMNLKANEKVELKRHRSAGNRMLEHYMRREGLQTEAPAKVAVSPAMAVRLGAVPKTGTVTGAKSKPRQPTAELVPVKRVRKVDPAEEGHYVISMPKGTTMRTKTLLQKQKQAATAKSSTVFDRLGKEVPGAKVGGAKMGVAKPAVSGGSQGVFSRLGGVQGQRTRSLSDSSQKSVLGYKGVLKEPEAVTQPQEKTLTVKMPTAFMDTFAHLQRPEISTTTSTAKRGMTRGMTPVRARLGGRAGIVPPKAKSPITGPSLRQRVGPTHAGGAQSPKVTVTLGGLNGGQAISRVTPARAQAPQKAASEPSRIQGRLGPKARAERFGSPSLFSQTIKAAATGRVAKPKQQARSLVSDEPKQKVTMKERLGSFKAEASSTTPTFNVTAKNIQAGRKPVTKRLNLQAVKKPVAQRVGKNQSMAGSKSNVFSRLGQT